MVRQRKPTGVSNTEVDVAETMLGLSNILSNLPPPHGRHEVPQMQDGTLHADRGKHKIDLTAESLHSPILIANSEDRQKKRKHEDEAIPELKQRPNGLLSTQRCTEVVQHDDRHRQGKGKIILKIKLGNRSLGTKASLTCSLIEDQFSGAGSENLMHAPSYAKKNCVSQKADAMVADSATEQFFSGHARFSFSILQLLTAVRMALIIQSASDEHTTGEGSRPDVISTGQVKRNGLSSLTIQEIVQRVEQRPGDPKILETEEPLQDLVKGVLNVFSSQRAHSGVKSWTGLAAHDTSTKRWYWIGPVPSELSKSWGISPEILPEMIDSFAEWMRQRQETTELIRSLPPAPESLIQNPEMEVRYRLLKSQRNPNTISQSSEEVKAYFHMEEALRYRITDRVFPYTARDGTKCTVSPVRRCSDKSSSGKGRDHYLLKRTRPDHFSVRCLVRDAAARLPGRIGTRADISTLVRDSQYIVENIPDVEIQQIVRRCLDRLHYGTDPCVRFDRETNLWVYLHGDRIDVDFMERGPSPRHKSRRSESEDKHTESKAVHRQQEK